MDLVTSLSLGATNLVSVPVLAFVLGVCAAALRADLRLPDAVYQAISMYLLLAIGLKGGVALRESNATEVAAPIAATLALGVVTPVLAFWALRLLTPLARVDRAAMSAHYGSTSLVTFTAALVFLDSAGVAVEGYASTLLAVLEIPGIIDMWPKLFVIHSDHISNGAKGVIAPWFEAPFSPLFPESAIHSSSSISG